MASMSIKNGRCMIQFRGIDRRVCTLRLGKLSDGQASIAKSHIENLIAVARLGMQPSPGALHWLSRLNENIHDKLVSAGIAQPRALTGLTHLGKYFADYIVRRTDLKQNSILNLRKCRTAATEYFGEGREMATITRGDVRDWKRKLRESYAEATVAGNLKRLRQLFADAIDHEVVAKNPVVGISPGSMSNAKRMFYVSRESILKVIEECPDVEWRLLFSMARFAGLRVPTEIRSLRWADVIWDQSRIIVRSSKTERFEGKEQREIPIFAEIADALMDAFHLAQPQSEFVFARLRGVTLRTMAMKIVARAGVEQWPRLFQNLRSSCETDLVVRHKMHVACAWIGNSAGVALKHYLQVTPSDFDMAVVGAEKSAVTPLQNNEGHLANSLGSEDELPPAGIVFTRESLEETQKAHVALQKALRAAQKNLRGYREASIDELQSQLAAARGGRQ